MREALVINLTGAIIDVELVNGELTELRPISGKDPESPEDIIVIGYLTTERVPEGTYKPVYDFDENKFVEGLTQEEIDEIRNAPQPETAEQKIAALESENAFIALELVDTQIRLDQSEQSQADLLLLLVGNGVL
jgi:hypothetical protein